MDTVSFINGSPSTVAHGWTLAVVSEGYTLDDLTPPPKKTPDETQVPSLFDRDVFLFCNALLLSAPFNDPAIRRLINIVAVRVPSVGSGNKIVVLNPTPPVSPFNTAFGAMYAREKFNGQPIERLLYGDSNAVKNFVCTQPHLAKVQHFLVIVNNSAIYGGARKDDVGWTSKEGATWPLIAIHELGHQAFALADEYSARNDEATDLLRSYKGVEPEEPNITIQTTIEAMRWKTLVTLPQRLVPTTVKTESCIRIHDVIPDTPPVPADAVGAYEGAGYFDCGIFRPSLTCKMRVIPAPFCKVCDAEVRRKFGGYLLRHGGGTPRRAGAWTHVQTFVAGAAARTLAYDAASPGGAYAISNNADFLGVDRRPDGTPPLDKANPALGTGSIGFGWNNLVPFTSGGSLHYFAHEFGSGRQAIFQMNAAGDTLTQTFSGGSGATWSHIVSLVLGGVPHIIGYNSFTGAADLFSIGSNSADPKFIVSMDWRPGQTAAISLTLDGEPFVLTYHIGTGEVAIRHILSSGFKVKFASAAGFWQRNATHLALVEAFGSPYVLRYSAIDGSSGMHRIRKDGSGIDALCSLNPGPGPGALAMLGVGVPSVGIFPLPAPLPAAESLTGIFVYKRLTETLQLYLLT